MGMGDSHRLCTIGMGKRFEFGGYPRPISKLEAREYLLKLRTTLTKEQTEELGVYGPVDVTKEREFQVVSSVSKEVEDEIKLRSGINPSKLLNLLDEI